VLAIGEFSRVTHLSVRTLRRYHDAGLLEPATVDPASGYRYYTADQIPTAQVIHRLRELDVSLPDVRRILRSPDPGTRAALVSDHLRRLESELDRTRAAVASLRRLLTPQPAALGVELRAVPAATVAAVEDDVELDHVLDWYAGAMAELDAVVREPTGVPGGLYDNALFETGRGHLLVYRPTSHPPHTGRVHPVTLPAVELAVTTHTGEHDDIDVTYGELGAWVVSNALVVAGPATADGALSAVLAVADHRFAARAGSGLAGLRVGVLGVGSVGSRLSGHLAAAGAQLVLADVDPGRRAVADRLGAEWTDPARLPLLDLDILVPAAVGGLLTEALVPRLRCAAVVGPANNQLASDHVATLLHRSRVLWAPDYLVSAGGIVSAVARELHHHGPDQAAEQVRGIGITLTAVLRQADQEHLPPHLVARRLARSRLGPDGRRGHT
jgi:DNA-binding transcriptional MerR regulator